jgi:hypothetical protein
MDISEKFDLLVLKIQKFGDYRQIAEIPRRGQFEPNVAFDMALARNRLVEFNKIINPGGIYR